MPTRRYEPILNAPSLGRKLILLVSHDGKLIATTQAAIQHANVGLVAVCEGKEFAGRLRTFIPDLILLDLDTIATSLKEILVVSSEWVPSTPVLSLAGVSSHEQAVDSVKLGAKGYLSKPVSDDRLVSRIQAEFDN